MKTTKSCLKLCCLLLALCLLMAGCGQQAAPSAPAADPAPAANDTPAADISDQSQPEAEPASAFPEEDILIYCQFSAGGGNDVQLRAIVPYIQKYLPKSVNVVADNKTGGGGIVCSNYVYASAPDGYTLMQAQMGTMLVQQMYSNEISFDCDAFTWLGIYAFDTSVLVVRPDLDVNSWDDLVAYSQNNQLNFGTAGVGSNTHVQAALFINATGLDANLVHYSDGTSAVIAAMGRGEVDAYIFGLGNQSIAAEENGSARTVCVLDAERSDFIPDVPTLEQFGCPADITADVLANPITSAPRGFCAPPNLPEDVKGILDEAISKALADPEMIAWAEANMLTWTPMNAEETQKYVSDGLAQLVDYADMLASIME